MSLALALILVGALLIYAAVKGKSVGKLLAGQDG